MPAAAFDTLKLARRLQGIGLPADQAAGFAEALDLPFSPVEALAA